MSTSSCISNQALKDAVDNITTNSGTRTKNGSIAELLAKLLTILSNLAISALLLFSVGRLPTFSNSHGRHIRVVRVLLLRGTTLSRRGISILRLRVGGGSVRGRLLLLVLNEDIVPGEYALLAGSGVLAHPPVLIHVLMHNNLVILIERYIAVIRSDVAVQSPCMGKHRLDGSAG